MKQCIFKDFFGLNMSGTSISSVACMNGQKSRPNVKKT